jgi:hypothetical protein
VGSTPGGCDHAGARTDPELGSALASSWRDPIASLVNTLRVLHGARAEEDPRSDLRVLPPITGQPRDLPFLGGAIITCLDRPLARGPARRCSSQRARSANASIPIASSSSLAVRNCSRASPGDHHDATTRCRAPEDRVAR